MTTATTTPTTEKPNVDNANAVLNRTVDLNQDLEKLDDEQLKTLISDAYKLLDDRKRERERIAKEEIRKMAIEAGIKVSFAETAPRKRSRRKSEIET